MIYKNIRRAYFIDRPNRFIANIEIDGEKALCHVKNTGRCKELLTERAKIFVQESDACGRKTKYDLISVYKGDRLVNIDSQVPNTVFKEWAAGGGLFYDIKDIRPEYRIGASRFDFYIEADGKKSIVEVKGVTLERDGAALFPDAPTERGVKHLRGLAECAKRGYDAYIVFIVQMKGVLYVAPNMETHPAFGADLLDASMNGVHMLAMDCLVTEDSITVDRPLEVRLL